MMGVVLLPWPTEKYRDSVNVIHRESTGKS